MQVFVPFDNHVANAVVLDDKRLLKQIVEIGQIITAIEKRKSGDKKAGWVNHPAVIMWEDSVLYLICYYNVLLIEFVRRGGKPNKLQPIPMDEEQFEEALLNKPHWWGRIDVHESHKKMLLWKTIPSKEDKTFMREYKLRWNKKYQDSFMMVNPKEKPEYVWVVSK